jgi:hypothetical protein
MLNHERYEAEWEGMRLVVYARPDHWQVTVYDPAQCEVVYTAERMSIASAKFAAVAFVAVAQFGPRHGLKAEVIAEMLVWERSA